MIVVVGAGLSGLVCARILQRVGRDVLVLDAGTTAGGRLRTRVTPDGFRLDEGFQVLFTAYPGLRRHVHLSELAPRYFSSGVEVAGEGGPVTLGHPLYNPRSIPGTVAAGLFRPGDIIALARLLASSLSLGDAPLPSANRSSLDALKSLGLSEHFIRSVFVPLFGGISLDRSLSSDATFLKFVLRAMAVGRAFVPAFGVQELPRYLTQVLSPESVKLDTRVENLVRERGRVVGVQTSRGEIAADAVVIATDPREACRLARVSIPDGQRSCTTAYFAGRRPLYGRRLVLNATGSLVNHVVQLSQVAPEYAPPGRHLLAAVVTAEMKGTKSEVATQIVEDLANWSNSAEAHRLDVLDVVRVGYAQFAQLPGVYSTLPGPVTAEQGLFLAGEFLHSSSTQGAIRGGEMAAAALQTAGF